MIGSFATALVVLLIAYSTFVGDWAVLKSKGQRDNENAVHQLALKHAELQQRVCAIEQQRAENQQELMKQLDYIILQVDKLRDKE